MRMISIRQLRVAPGQQLPQHAIAAFREQHEVRRNLRGRTNDFVTLHLCHCKQATTRKAVRIRNCSWHNVSGLYRCSCDPASPEHAHPSSPWHAKAVLAVPPSLTALITMRYCTPRPVT